MTTQNLPTFYFYRSCVNISSVLTFHLLRRIDKQKSTQIGWNYSGLSKMWRRQRLSLSLWDLKLDFALPKGCSVQYFQKPGLWWTPEAKIYCTAVNTQPVDTSLHILADWQILQRSFSYYLRWLKNNLENFKLPLERLWHFPRCFFVSSVCGRRGVAAWVWRRTWQKAGRMGVPAVQCRQSLCLLWRPKKQIPSFLKLKQFFSNHWVSTKC